VQPWPFILILLPQLSLAPFATKWLMTIFCNVLPLETTLRFAPLLQFCPSEAPGPPRSLMALFSLMFQSLRAQGVGLPAAGGQRRALQGRCRHAARHAEGPSFLSRRHVIQPPSQSPNPKPRNLSRNTVQVCAGAARRSTHRHVGLRCARQGNVQRQVLANGMRALLCDRL
jgi:hypothetical protein